jgi:hypothetical protein
LGWLALAWIEFFVIHGPGDIQGEPVEHGDEYSGFIVDCYALDEGGRRLYDSAFFSRPKGADKSGLGGRIALFEALGPCRFLGWAEGGEVYRDPWGLGFQYAYEAGEPMGRPVNVPYIRCMATEEGQTGNVYDTIHYNLTQGPLADALARADDAGLTRVLIPGGGEVTPSTASAASKDGGKETWVDFDESHLYNTPELRQMYRTVTRNLRKRKKLAETWFLETTTMYAAGEESIAEQTYTLAEKIREGKSRATRLLLDHRWGECEDLADEKASRRYFLNAPSATSDAWIANNEWAARIAAEKIVEADEPITLGFDGSRSRNRGVTDATALIGCRVSDGHIFELGVWEQPAGPLGEGWQVPVIEVEALIRETFQDFNVVGFYADPAKWESYVAKWEATYADQLQVGGRDHPIEWWMTGGRATKTVTALREFQDAVLDGDMTHDGSLALTRHVLNARRRVSKSGIQIAKEHPDSIRKIADQLCRPGDQFGGRAAPSAGFPYGFGDHERFGCRGVADLAGQQVRLPYPGPSALCGRCFACLRDGHPESRGPADADLVG